MKRNIAMGVLNVDDIFEYCESCIYYDECELSVEDFEESGMDDCPYFEPAEEEVC